MKIPFLPKIMREAWHNLKPLIVPISLSYILMISVFVALTILCSITLDHTFEMTKVNHPIEVLLMWPVHVCLLLIIISGFFFYAVMSTLAVRQVSGLPPHLKTALQDCWKVKKTVLLLNLYYYVIPIAIIIGAIIVRSLLFLDFYILFYFLQIPISIFALPLIVTKHYSARKAIISSYSTFFRNFNFFVTTLCYTITLFILLSSMNFIIPVIVTLPFFCACNAVMFCKAYGER